MEKRLNIYKEIKKQVRNVLSENIVNENVQLADKVYFKPKKLSDKAREIIVDKITGGDAWTKIIADIYYEKLERGRELGKWNLGQITGEEESSEDNKTGSDILSIDELKKIKSYHQQLKNYNKNVFPIKGLNPNGVDDIYSLIWALDNRGKILDEIKELPSIAIRNLKPEIREPRNGAEMDLFRDRLEYFLGHYGLLSNRSEEARRNVEKKMFKSGITIDKLIDFAEEKEGLLGGEELDRGVVKNMVESHGELEIVYEKRDAMVVEVSDAQGIKTIGCNSLWCFTYSDDFYRNWSTYSYNGLVYVIIDFSEPSDSSDFMNVVIKPLVWNPTYDGEEDINDETIFDMANNNRYDALSFIDSVIGLDKAKNILTFYEQDEVEDQEKEKETFKDPNQLSLFEVRRIVRKGFV